MMKRERPEILEGRCDSCGADLKQVEHSHQDGDPTRPQEFVYWEYATVKPDFGYGSRTLDMLSELMPEIHLCERCFLRMMEFLKIKLPDPFKTPQEKLRLLDELSSEAQKMGLYDKPKEGA